MQKGVQQLRGPSSGPQAWREFPPLGRVWCTPEPPGSRNGRRPAEPGPHTPPHAFPAQRLNPVPNISIWFLNSSRLKAQFSPYRGAWGMRRQPQGSEMSLGVPGAQAEKPPALAAADSLPQTQAWNSAQVRPALGLDPQVWSRL